MILGFKDRFEPYIVEGSKTHTIRGGNRWRAGMRADLFVRPRQKDMRLLFRAPVTKVEGIRIYGSGLPNLTDIEIDGQILSEDEKDQLAWRDGFRHPIHVPSFALMLHFWEGRLPFTGQIIHWDYSERLIPCRDCGSPSQAGCACG